MSSDERSCVAAIGIILIMFTSAWVLFMLGLALAVRLAGTQ